MQGSTKLYPKSVLINVFYTNKCFQTSLFFRPVNTVVRVSEQFLGLTRPLRVVCHTFQIAVSTGFINKTENCKVARNCTQKAFSPIYTNKCFQTSLFFRPVNTLVRVSQQFLGLTRELRVVCHTFLIAVSTSFINETDNCKVARNCTQKAF